ncbi:MAG TPA: gliding motility-associated C-terminal domain-containing protein [Chitinophagaceae bacterium]|nr:gliding motility-associated C-terminal domain-containing protein [Chitinophagaceae bacterium]
MTKRVIQYCFLLSMTAVHFNNVSAQGGVGAPIYLQDFGPGHEDPAFVGTALPPTHSAFTFTNDLCPAPGSYTIVRRMNVAGCYKGEWLGVSRDHITPGKDVGMFMMINNTSSASPRIVYTDTVRKTLCGGTSFEFSTALLNIDDKAKNVCFPTDDLPRFALTVEDGAGNVLGTDTTSGIYYAAPIEPYKFGEYYTDFTLASDVSMVVLKVTLLKSSAYNDCGDDFAIDDVMLTALGAKVNANFIGQPANYIFSSVCFQDNKTISMTGDMQPFYTNPQIQWQQSTDNGVTWIDIPGATGNSYSRSFSVPDTFLFRLSGAGSATMANPDCRVVSQVLTVNVNGLPKDFKVTNTSPVCSGQTLFFEANGGDIYNWYGPNGFSQTVFNPNIGFASLADSGMHYVDIITQGGCYATDSTYVKVIGTDVHAGPNASICKGQQVQLQATIGTSYSWAPAAGLNSTKTPNPKARPAATTVYVVTVTDKDGCSDTAHVTINVVNGTEVKAVIDGTEYLCRSIDSASFRSVSEGNITKWEWDLGNAQTDTTAKPPPQYYTIPSAAVTYIVRLSVSDNTGCKDTAYRVLKVEDNCYIAVPSAFTPNGDGLNDYLYPVNAFKATNLSFRIYNRWGDMIWETRDWTRKWDGTVKGVPQATGVFVWMLDYTDAANKRVSLRGTTVLIR